MSKKQKKQKTQAEGRSSAEYYKLHTKAVEDLVNADESNSPEVSKEELQKYRSGSRIKLAGWVKILFIKFWFPAAVCYFFIWGLSTYVQDLLDMLVITAIALGVVTDILTNNILRWFASTEGEYDRYMMFPKRGYITFPLNILYAGVVLFFVFMIYNMINAIACVASGTWGQTFLGVEPVLFGLFYLGVDTLFVEAKHMCGRILQDAINKTKTT